MKGWHPMETTRGAQFHQDVWGGFRARVGTEPTMDRHIFAKAGKAYGIRQAEIEVIKAAPGGVAANQIAQERK